MKGRLQALPTGGFPTKVAGDSFDDRQDAIDASLIEAGVVLFREYGNGFDDFAIRVLRADDGRQIGYIPAVYTPHLAEYAEGYVLAADVLDVTGGTPDKPNRGVNIYIYTEDGSVLPSKEWMLGEGRRAS